MIRVLVAEDSPTARQLLVRILKSDPEIEVIAEAADGLEAVELAQKLKPSLITMDIQMPRLGGLGATERIMQLAPTPIVIVSGLDVRNVTISLEALRAGAIALLPKPVGPLDPDFKASTARFLSTVRAMARVPMQRPSIPAALVPLRAPRVKKPPEVVAIVASAGGPAVLNRVLTGLPEDFPLPILIVQHIAPGFVEGLATWLDDAAKIVVKISVAGEPLRGATAYVAPDALHLAAGPDRCVLLSGAPIEEGFRPSGSFLLRSVAQVYRGGAVGLVLTGMGSDGSAGALEIHRAGGRVAAQDEATSVIYSMPREVVSAGIADAVLALDDVAGYLCALR